MRISEIFEIGLILLVGVFCWFTGPLFPEQVDMGNLLLLCSALLFLQSLIRDLHLLYSARNTSPTEKRTKTRCICMDSTVGIIGIVTGGILLASQTGMPIEMTRWCWFLTAVLTLGTGFLIKDYIIQAYPLRILKDKDHVTFLVTLRE